MKQNFKAISSSDNPRYKLWKKLIDPRKAKSLDQFLLAGRKLVPEFLRSHGRMFTEMIVPADFEINFSPPSHLKIFSLPTRLFREIDESGTDFPLLLGQRPELKVFEDNSTHRGLELLCGLGDPNNLGAVLRSAEAFGVHRVVILQEAASPFHPKALRASAGSSLRLELYEGPSIQNISGEIFALDMDGEAIESFKWPKNLRLLMGEEGQGVPTTLREVRRLRIKMNSSIESLNAMAATSIALYSYRLSHPL